MGKSGPFAKQTRHHHRFRRDVVCGGLMGQYVAQIERYHWPSSKRGRTPTDGSTVFILL